MIINFRQKIRDSPIFYSGSRSQIENCKEPFQSCGNNLFWHYRCNFIFMTPISFEIVLSMFEITVMSSISKLSRPTMPIAYYAYVPESFHKIEQVLLLAWIRIRDPG